VIGGELGRGGPSDTAGSGLRLVAAKAGLFQTLLSREGVEDRGRLLLAFWSCGAREDFWPSRGQGKCWNLPVGMRSKGFPSVWSFPVAMSRVPLLSGVPATRLVTRTQEFVSPASESP